MKPTRVWRVSLTTFALTCLLFICPATLSAAWQVGVARTCITPQRSMWMAGYAHRSHPADGTLSELWAKAMVLDDGQRHRAVIVSLDVVGISRSQAQTLCEELKKRLGFERHQIALCCSHTHSGPVIGDNLKPLHYAQLDKLQQTLVDQYASTLIPQVVGCVEQALAATEPCAVTYGSGRCSVAVNRRNNREADVPQPARAGDASGTDRSRCAGSRGSCRRRHTEGYLVWICLSCDRPGRLSMVGRLSRLCAARTGIGSSGRSCHVLGRVRSGPEPVTTPSRATGAGLRQAIGRIGQCRPGGPPVDGHRTIDNPLRGNRLGGRERCLRLISCSRKPSRRIATTPLADGCCWRRFKQERRSLKPIRMESACGTWGTRCSSCF